VVVDHSVATARPLRLALVGIGDAGAHHLRALRALGETGQVELVAVCTRDAARAQARLVELGFPATVQHFSTLQDLLGCGSAQAAILATPDGLHGAQITACVSAGLHVLVEKPLALHPTEAGQAVAAARQAGTVLQVGYHLRHHAAHTLVRPQVEALIGRLHNLSLRWAWPDPATTGWRARGESARFWSLAALGTHAIDLCQWIAGSPVAACSGLTIPPLNEGVDRCAEVSLRFGSGPLAHISVSVTHRALSRMLLVGERGEVECLGTFGARGTGEVWLRPLGKPAEPIPFTPHDPYAAQLGAFVAAVQARSMPATSPPLMAPVEDPGLADALKNVELLDSLAALPGSAPLENLHAKPCKT
jgi:predicted dehydrogenase